MLSAGHFSLCILLLAGCVLAQDKTCAGGCNSGTCVQGICVCDAPYYGPQCSTAYEKFSSYRLQILDNQRGATNSLVKPIGLTKLTFQSNGALVTPSTITARASDYTPLPPPTGGSSPSNLVTGGTWNDPYNNIETTGIELLVQFTAPQFIDSYSLQCAISSAKMPAGWVLWGGEGSTWTMLDQQSMVDLTSERAFYVERDPCKSLDCGYGYCINGQCVCRFEYTGANCLTPPSASAVADCQQANSYVVSATTTGGATPFRRTVAASISFTCAIQSGGNVQCWGDPSIKSPPAGLSFVSIDAGTKTVCGVLTTGKAYCWGDNSFGVATPPGRRFSQVSVAETHACGITPAGELVCWGKPLPYDPATVPDSTVQFSQIDVGTKHACGILQVTNRVHCWGADSLISTTPANVFAQVVVSSAGSCGVTAGTSSADGGSVLCWPGSSATMPPNGKVVQVDMYKYDNPLLGSSTELRCTVNTLGVRLCTPNVDAPGVSFTSMAVGPYHVCGVSVSGALTCQCSDCANYAVDKNQWRLPASFVGKPAFSHVTVAEGYGCGIHASDSTGWTAGQLECWGAATAAGGSISTQAVSSSRWREFWIPEASLGSPVQCGVLTNRQLSCVNIVATTLPTPIAVPPIGNFQYLSVVSQGACAIRTYTAPVTDGRTVDCWGMRQSETPLFKPVSNMVTAPFNRPYATLSVSPYMVCGVLTSGVILCWNNGNGDGSSLAFLLPSQARRVPPLGDLFVSVSVTSGTPTYTSACGLLLSGAVQCWSLDTLIQFPDKNIAYKALSLTTTLNSNSVVCAVTMSGVPVCFGILSNNVRPGPASASKFRQIAVNGANMCGLREDLVPECWEIATATMTVLPTSTSIGPAGSSVAMGDSGWASFRPYSRQVIEVGGGLTGTVNVGVNRAGCGVDKFSIPCADLAFAITQYDRSNTLFVVSGGTYRMSGQTVQANDFGVRAVSPSSGLSLCRTYNFTAPVRLLNQYTSVMLDFANGVGLVFTGDNILIDGLGFMNGGGLGGILELATSRALISGALFQGSFANVVVSRATVDVKNSNFVSTSATVNGGALSAFGSTLTVTDSNFQGCVAGQDGGCIYATQSTVLLVRAVVNNAVAVGRGGFFHSLSSAVNMNAVQVFNCAAGSRGGGVYVERSNFTTTNSQFNGNQAADRGGAIDGVVSQMNVLGTSFTSNRLSYNPPAATPNAQGGGGAVSCVSACTSASTTAAPVILTPLLTVTNSNFTTNQAGSGFGGGIYADGCVLMGRTSQFVSNSAKHGGGLAMLSVERPPSYAPSGSILDSLRLDNNTAEVGAGLYASGHVTTFAANPTSSPLTFTNNYATNKGGGLYWQLQPPENTPPVVASQPNTPRWENDTSGIVVGPEMSSTVTVFKGNMALSLPNIGSPVAAIVLTSSPPGGLVVSGQPFSPGFTVTLQDKYGAVVIDDTLVITASLSAADISNRARLDGMTTTRFVKGVAVFDAQFALFAPTGGPYTLTFATPVALLDSQGAGGGFTTLTATYNATTRACISGERYVDSLYCSPCAAGSFSQIAVGGAIPTQCTPCAAGKFGNVTGAMGCVDCPVTTAQKLTGQTACTQCAPGTYSNTSGLMDCWACNPGSFQSLVGAQGCIACDRGQYAPLSRHAFCLSCGKGEFAPDQGMRKCLVCPANSRPTDVGSWCTCDSGYYMAPASIFTNLPASAGFANVCPACPTGANCGTAGTVSLSALTGWWAPVSKLTNPSPFTQFYSCPFDSCMGGNGSAASPLCAAGYEGPVCGVCSSGYYFNKQGCSSCSTGQGATNFFLFATCIAALLVVVFFAGYSRRRKQKKKDDAELMEKIEKGDADELARIKRETVGETREERAARKKQEKEEEKARKDHDKEERRLAKEKEKEDRRLAKEREKERKRKEKELRKQQKEAGADGVDGVNPGGEADAIAAAEASLSGVPSVASELKEDDPDKPVVEGGELDSEGLAQSMYDQKHKTQDYNRTKAEKEQHKQNMMSRFPLPVLIILVGFLQVIGVTEDYYRIPWPAFFANAFMFWKGLVGDSIKVLAATCNQSWNFYDVLVFNTMFPMALLVVAYVIYFITPCRCCIPIRASAMKFGSTFLMIIYPGVTLTCLKLFPCQKVEGVYYLTYDYSLECYTGRYWASALWSMLVLVIFTVGVPLVYIWVMVEASKQGLLKTREWREIYGHLYLCYRPEVYWWEGVELIRKFLLTGLIVILGNGSSFSLIIAILISMFAHLLHTYYKPYLDHANQELQHLVMSAIVFTLFSGLVLKINAASDYQAQALAGFVLVLNYWILGYSAFTSLIKEKARSTFKFTKDFLNKRLKEEADKKATRTATLSSPLTGVTVDGEQPVGPSDEPSALGGSAEAGGASADPFANELAGQASPSIDNESMMTEEQKQAEADSAFERAMGGGGGGTGEEEQFSLEPARPQEEEDEQPQQPESR